MNYNNLLKVAIKAILSHKSRTLLSMLGIIIGVAAVIVMMAIGQGSKESIREEISKMGTNLLTIRPGGDMRGGVRRDPSEMQTLKIEDYESIRDKAKLVAKISPEVSASGQVIFGGNNTTSTIYGETDEYLEIKQWKVGRGACFTDDDVRKSAKVCVVGATIVKELFGEKCTTPPIGKTIRFKNIPFRIVGVLEAKGYNNWGMDQDNVIIAPYTTVMKRIQAQTYLSSIVCSALTEELSDDAIDEITTILRTNHKLKEDADDNFTIRSQQEMMNTMTSTMDTVTIILVVAAAFSLLVAGIGIMNIMLVTVTERTREIGIRRAIGAQRSSIVTQFLIEAGMLCGMGGIVGIIFGTIGSVVLGRIIYQQTIYPVPWVTIAAFALSVALGVLFGSYPAIKASKLQPVEALRAE